MTRPFPRLGATLLLAASLAFVTACSSAQDPQTLPSESPSPTAILPAPSASAATEEPETPAGDPTCETIIPESVIAHFESVGWTVRSESFRVGELEIPEGVSCVWGDYTIASDHVQLFGWAPISQAQAQTAQQELTQGGWTRESGPDGEYVTEDKSTAIATDSDGYGLTYLFGDGWVKFADTKQGLLLIQWPPS